MEETFIFSFIYFYIVLIFHNEHEFILLKTNTRFTLRDSRKNDS